MAYALETNGPIIASECRYIAEASPYRVAANGKVRYMVVALAYDRSQTYVAACGTAKVAYRALAHAIANKRIAAGKFAAVVVTPAGSVVNYTELKALIAKAA